MPKQRCQAREEAFRRWQQSDGKLPLVRLAEELGVKASQVRNWKAKDNWEARKYSSPVPKAQSKGKSQSKTQSNKTKTQSNAAQSNAKTQSNAEGQGEAPVKKNRRGGIPGNRGNRYATGAPMGHKYNLKCGAFERYAYGHMEADEAEVAKDALTDPDIEAELRSSLAFLKARELRLMKRIERIRNMEAEGEAATIAARQSTVSDTQRDIHKGSEHEHTEMDVTSTSSTEDMLNKLEAELHKVHNQKVKILTQLDNMKLQRERLEVERMRVQGENDQSRLANEWVQALLAVMSEGERGEGDE